MFREMLQSDRQLSEKEIPALLEQGEYGTLAVLGDDDYAYAVPLNYVYEAGKIYIHGSKDGHKVDALQSNPKVSFCVISDATVKPEQFTFSYTSVIAFGVATLLKEKEKRTAIERFVHKYSAEHWDRAQKIIPNVWDKFVIFEIAIEHVTAKQKR